MILDKDQEWPSHRRKQRHINKYAPYLCPLNSYGTLAFTQNYLFNIYGCFICTYACASHAWCLQRPEEGVSSSGTGVKRLISSDVDSGNWIKASGRAATVTHSPTLHINFYLLWMNVFICQVLFIHYLIPIIVLWGRYYWVLFHRYGNQTSGDCLRLQNWQSWEAKPTSFYSKFILLRLVVILLYAYFSAYLFMTFSIICFIQQICVQVFIRSPSRAFIILTSY